MRKYSIVLSTLLKGGAEKQAICLLNLLGENDFVYLFVIYPEKGIEQGLLDRISINNYKTVYLSGNIFNKFVSFYRQTKSNGVSCIFSYLTLPNIFAAFCGRLLNLKEIYLGIRTTYLPLWKVLLENIANKMSKLTIINCYSGKSIFLKKGIKKIEVIPNCFENISDALTRPLKETVTIISVGRFVEAKDYFTAIRAYSLLLRKYDNLKIQIVGYGLLEDKIRNWLKDFNIENFVDVVVNPPNVKDLLYNADIYLSTSIYEGTSNSILEAMDASLPVVATNVGDNSFMVRENENGYIVNVKDVDAICNKLGLLIEDYNLRIKMGKKSNFILKEKYSLDCFRANYINICGL